MIRIGILGNIGSGKSYVANNFGYPVFNADHEVSELYKKNKKIFNKLNKILPKHITTFPIEKKEVVNAILSNKKNLKKIIKVVHKEIRAKMQLFIKKNKNKKIVIMDIPLLLENKINNKTDVLVFVEAKNQDIEKKLKKRKNFNPRIYKKFKKMQFSPVYKRNKSNFIIKNDFKKKTITKSIKNILSKVL